MIQLIIQCNQAYSISKHQPYFSSTWKTVLSSEHLQAQQMDFQTNSIIYHRQIIRMSFQSLVSG